jgi:hypothetical protein
MHVTDNSLFPDGGFRAWSVVGASFLHVFCSFGKCSVSTILTPRDNEWLRHFPDVSYSTSITESYSR